MVKMQHLIPWQCLQCHSLDVFSYSIKTSCLCFPAFWHWSCYLLSPSFGVVSPCPGFGALVLCFLWLCTWKEKASREIENSSFPGVFQQRWTKPPFHVCFVSRLYPGAERPPMADGLQNGHCYLPSLPTSLGCNIEVAPIKRWSIFLQHLNLGDLMICSGQQKAEVILGGFWA